MCEVCIIQKDEEYVKEMARLLRAELNIQTVYDVDIYVVIKRLGGKIVHNPGIEYFTELAVNKKNRAIFTVNKNFRESPLQKITLARHLGAYIFMYPHESIDDEGENVNKDTMFFVDWENKLYLFAAYLLVGEDLLIEEMNKSAVTGISSTESLAKKFNVTNTLLNNLKEFTYHKLGGRVG